MSNEATKKHILEKWSKIFKLFFYGTPLITLFCFVAQLFFTWEVYSFDLSKLSNWQSFSTTFSFPLGMAAGLLAITTLIGMFHRSLQLTVQLEKVERQLEISNQQFELSHNKENFMLFVEHNKALKEVIESNFSSLKSVASNVMTAKGYEYKFGVEVNFTRFYSKAFPQNSTRKMVVFDLESDQSSKGNDLFCALNSWVEEVEKHDLKELSYQSIKPVIGSYGDFGFQFKTTSYDSDLSPGGVWLANILLDVQLVVMISKQVGLLEKDDTLFLQNRIYDLALKVLNYHKELDPIS